LAERDREATAQQPSAAELLRAALDKIVFFEWRVSELAGEVAAAHRRCALAETARVEAEEAARAAANQAKSARMQCAEMEAEQARISALLSNPAQGRAAADAKALDSERRRSDALASELEQARAELARSRAERERWLTEMIAQARTGEEAPAALAQFISELRGEVIALRDHRKKCEAALAEAKVAVPAFEAFDPPPPPPPSPEPVDEGRRMWAEGRLAAAAPVAAAHFVLPAEAGGSAAARALADQCLRSLASADSRRREQAARHLAAAPLPAAAPAVAAALSAETAPKARAELAKALAACGGDTAAEIVAGLQGEGEPALVRLAALDALCALPQRARAAIEVAARDNTAAVRRRAAALAVLERLDDLAARFAADEDASVRSALAAARSEAPLPVAAAKLAPAAPVQQEPEAKVASAPRPRDPVRAALQRLVLEGGSR
jgi:hypothetical protein